MLNDSIAVRAANKQSRILAPSPDIDEQSTVTSISMIDRNYAVNEDSSISFFDEEIYQDYEEVNSSHEPLPYYNSESNENSSSSSSNSSNSNSSSSSSNSSRNIGSSSSKKNTSTESVPILCCCECKYNATHSSHSCSVTGKKIMGFCGTDGEEEGYGNAVVCRSCKNLKNV